MTQSASIQVQMTIWVNSEVWRKRGCGPKLGLKPLNIRGSAQFSHFNISSASDLLSSLTKRKRSTAISDTHDREPASAQAAMPQLPPFVHPATAPLHSPILTLIATSRLAFLATGDLLTQLKGLPATSILASHHGCPHLFSSSPILPCPFLLLVYSLSDRSLTPRTTASCRVVEEGDDDGSAKLEKDLEVHSDLVISGFCEFLLAEKLGSEGSVVGSRWRQDDDGKYGGAKVYEEERDKDHELFGGFGSGMNMKR
ncbi:hypothetical protein LR48_Vigan02g120900 [Vigna angularis]|uniref:Uncharacterized protein n=1 Tax=Phaseolus angularis TaxID=3914 RepID=A0A0L9TY01_PHAAN|nr:hypothetical protein LR48_Vigan02g120900 [Vigna angularis]